MTKSFQPICDIISSKVADVSGDITLTRNAWLSRLAYRRLLLQHESTDRVFVSAGSPLSDVVFGWEVVDAGHGMYEFVHGHNDHQVFSFVCSCAPTITTTVRNCEFPQSVKERLQPFDEYFGSFDGSLDSVIEATESLPSADGYFITVRKLSGDMTDRFMC